MIRGVETHYNYIHVRQPLQLLPHYAGFIGYWIVI